MKKQKSLLRREEEQVYKLRKTYAQRYPALFALAGTFGFVATLYGFEKIIDRVDLFSDNPWILLATGISILLVSGAFYNKLQ